MDPFIGLWREKTNSESEDPAKKVEDEANVTTTGETGAGEDARNEKSSSGTPANRTQGDDNEGMSSGVKRTAKESPEIQPQKGLPSHLAALVKAREAKKLKGDVAKTESPADYKEAFTKLNEAVEALKDLKTKHPTTHSNIKAAINNLELAAWWLSTHNKKRSQEITKETASLLKEKEALAQRTEELLRENEATRENLEKVKQQAIEHQLTQNPLCSNCNKKIETERLQKITEEKNIREIEKKLENAELDESTAQLISKEWPAGVFKRCTLTPNSITTTKEASALIVTQGSEKDGILAKQLAPHFSLAASIMELPVGSVVVLHNNPGLEVVEDGGKGGELDRLTSLAKARTLTVGVVRRGSPPVEFLQTLMKVIGKTASYESAEPPILQVSEEWAPSPIRRAVEACCRIKGCHLQLVSKETARPAPSNSRVRDGSTPTEPVHLKSVRIRVDDGATLESTLRKISVKVDPGAAGVKIGPVTKNSEGDLILKVQETTPGGSTTFADMIKNGTNMQVDVRDSAGPTMTVMLRDVDPFLCAKQIEKELRVKLAVPEWCPIRTEDPRMPKHSWQCLATLPRAAAKKLLEMKSIEIGNARCRPQEWFTLPTCFNCQVVGHLAKECKKEKVSGPRCHKCGALGHYTKDCGSSERRCYVCEIEGHSASSWACPAFKKLFQARTHGDSKGAPSKRALAEQEAKAVVKNKKPRNDKRLKTVDEDGFITPSSSQTARPPMPTEQQTPSQPCSTLSK